MPKKFQPPGDYRHLKVSTLKVKENIKTSAKDSLGLYKLKHHKPWFDEERSKFLDYRKQAKMQWFQVFLLFVPEMSASFTSYIV